jgi:uncharacterized protein YjiS (DUF1127 family)
MTTFTTDASATGHALRNAAAQAVRQVAGSIRAAWVRGNDRRAYRRLLECDDILRDTGITRDDVRQAMAEWRH